MLHIDNKSYKFTFLNYKDNYFLLSYNNATKDILINCYPIREYEAEKLIEILEQNKDLPSFIKEKICNEIYLEVCVTRKNEKLKEKITLIINKEGDKLNG